MPLPALAAVAGLVAAAHLGRRGSAAELSEEYKKRIVKLVKQGLVFKAIALAVELGIDTLDLSGANLRNVDLSSANLFGANLTGADLSFAYLSDAKLYGANLTGADLSRSSLNRANLRSVDLYGANLSGAKLYGANLSDANLTGANLRNAELFDTDLTGANLTSANLDGAFILGATGINIGPTRTFIGIPYGYIKTESRFIPGRTNLRRTE